MKTWEHVELFPQASVTVKVRVIVPPHASPTNDPVEQLNVRGTEMSEADPPAAIKIASVAGQVGMSDKHCIRAEGKQPIVGGVTSIFEITHAVSTALQPFVVSKTVRI